MHNKLKTLFLKLKNMRAGCVAFSRDYDGFFTYSCASFSKEAKKRVFLPDISVVLNIDVKNFVDISHCYLVYQNIYNYYCWKSSNNIEDKIYNKLIYYVDNSPYIIKKITISSPEAKLYTNREFSCCEKKLIDYCLTKFGKDDPLIFVTLNPCFLCLNELHYAVFSDYENKIRRIWCFKFGKGYVTSCI